MDGGNINVLLNIVMLLVTAIVLPIMAYLFKRNDKQHEVNQQALAEHSRALAILIEQSATVKTHGGKIGSLEVEIGILRTLVDRYFGRKHDD